MGLRINFLPEKSETMEWLHVHLVAAFAGILILLLLIILQQFLHPKIRTRLVISDISETVPNLQDRISTPYHLDEDGSKKTNSVFSWTDHPSLVTDVFENGWSRFAFTTFVSAPPRDHKNGAYDNNVEVSWEISEGSEDYMQKIRVNPGLKKMITSLDSLSVIRTALPLPGPSLGNLSFPQEAYLEITVLEDIHNHKDEETLEKCEKDFNAKINPGSFVGEIGFGRKWDKKNEGIFCMGLTGGGPLQLKIPGRFRGSIGFNSSGSVYLDGTKIIVPESENHDQWGTAEKVVGCGYNPHQKKVFFTVDSQLIHEICCKTEEFRTPLYPTIAANTDITVVVNLGQSPFKFLPANLERTPNPCSIRPHNTNTPILGFEDSNELFSIGRFDPRWRNSTSNANTANSITSIEFDRASESDLFEIVLDRTRASPFTTSYP